MQTTTSIKGSVVAQRLSLARLSHVVCWQRHGTMKAEQDWRGVVVPVGVGVGRGRNISSTPTALGRLLRAEESRRLSLSLPGPRERAAPLLPLSGPGRHGTKSETPHTPTASPDRGLAGWEGNR